MPFFKAILMSIKYGMAIKKFYEPKFDEFLMSNQSFSKTLDKLGSRDIGDKCVHFLSL